MDNVKKTPLYDWHVANGGHMVEFTGYWLPTHYKTSQIEEHHAVRNAAGLFDVSHMGQFLLTGKGAEATLNEIVTVDAREINDGDTRYSLMLYPNGGQVDDMIIYKFNKEKFYIVINAANVGKDWDWFSAHLGPDTKIENLSEQTGQLAVQGRNAEDIMAEVADRNLLPKKFYTFVPEIEILGIKCIVSRTGYTGEDGFEIYCPSEDLVKLTEAIFEKGQKHGLVACGLGSRDTLRFEACLPLYGHELSPDFLATEVGLGFFLHMNKANFIGKKALEENPAQYKKRGIKMVDKGIGRDGNLLYDLDGNEIGLITTGTLSPTLGYPVAMIRVKKDFEGEELIVDVRGRKLKAQIAKTPFYKNTPLEKAGK
jgi:aminomethyltransferase